MVIQNSVILWGVVEDIGRIKEGKTCMSIKADSWIFILELLSLSTLCL